MCHVFSGQVFSDQFPLSSGRHNISRTSQYPFLSSWTAVQTFISLLEMQHTEGKGHPSNIAEFPSQTRSLLFSLPSQYFSAAIWHATWQVHHVAPFYSSPSCQGGRAIATVLLCVKSWHVIFHFQEPLEIVKHPYCSCCFILLQICIFLSEWQADAAVFKSPVGWEHLKLFPFPHQI